MTRTFGFKRRRRATLLGITALALLASGAVLVSGSAADHSSNHVKTPPNALGECGLTGPTATPTSTGGTLIAFALDCTQTGSSTANFGFPEKATTASPDSGPLFELSAAAAGLELLRMTDRLYDQGTGTRQRIYKKEILVPATVTEVCLKVAGKEMSPLCRS